MIISFGENFAAQQFLEEKIHFLDIPKVIEIACESHKNETKEEPSLNDVLSVDKWAREKVKESVKKHKMQLSFSEK